MLVYTGTFHSCDPLMDNSTYTWLQLPKVYFSRCNTITPSSPREIEQILLNWY